MAAGAMVTDKAKLKPAMGSYAGELSGNLEAQGAIASRKLELEKRYGPQYAAFTNQLIQEFGPAYAKATRQAAGTDEIFAKLIGQANDELDAGYMLPEDQAAELTNRFRAAAAARGLGFGVSDVGAETALLASESERMRRARQAMAAATARLASESIGGPGMVGAVTNQGPFFDPESQYAYGVNRQNQQNQQAANAFKAQKKLALGAGLMNMGGSLMGGGLSAAGGSGMFGSMLGGGGGGGMTIGNYNYAAGGPRW